MRVRISRVLVGIYLVCCSRPCLACSVICFYRAPITTAAVRGSRVAGIGNKHNQQQQLIFRHRSLLHHIDQNVSSVILAAKRTAITTFACGAVLDITDRFPYIHAAHTAVVAKTAQKAAPEQHHHRRSTAVAAADHFVTDTSTTGAVH